MGVTQMRFCA